MRRMRPTLEDLIHISPRPLPDWERFLDDWIAFLRAQSGSEADAWLREATRLSGGTRGLGALARADGQAHPRAYLDWFTALEEEGKQREILSGRMPGDLPANLGQVWQWGLLFGAGLWGDVESNPVYVRLERAYVEHLARVSLSDERQEDMLSWCLDVANRRVDAIVGGQHRNSYDQAAVLTVACAELLRLRGDVRAADAFVAEIRGRFPRHSRFRAEMESAIYRSEETS